MKNFSLWCLCLVGLLSTGNLSFAQYQPTEIKEDEQLIEFTTDRFTLPNIHVTPDKKHIIFDVLGDIYQVPIEGGTAKLILQDEHWKRGAKLSPDGKTLAYVSDENGNFQIWTYNLMTKEKLNFPTEQNKHYPLYPFWDYQNNLIIMDPEGIIKYSMVTKTQEIIRHTKKDERSLMNAIPLSISLNKNGKFAYIKKNEGFFVFNTENGEEIRLNSIDLEQEKYIKFYKINEEGNSLISIQAHQGGNALYFHDLKTGHKKNLFQWPVLGYSVSILQGFDFLDAQHIILDKGGEFIKINIDTEEYEVIPIEVIVKKPVKAPLHRAPISLNDSVISAKVLRNVNYSNKSNIIYFTAYGKLQRYHKDSKQIEELFPDSDRIEGFPSLSPDEQYLAYTTWRNDSKGHLYILDLETFKEYKITTYPGRYINPTWSPNGKELVLFSDKSPIKDNQLKYQSIGANPFYPLQLQRIKLNFNNRIKARSISNILEFSSFSVLAKRFFPIISFHSTKPHVFFANFNEEKEIPELIEFNLNSKKQVAALPLPFHLDEVTVSPNQKNVAFIYDEQVWVDSYPFTYRLNFFSDSDLISKDLHVSGGYIEGIDLPDAKPIYEVAPSYLFWQSEHVLIWSSAEEIYQYDVRTKETIKIAEIYVQKQRATPNSQYALINARIITMNKEDDIIEKGTILINNNRIKDVGFSSQISIPDDYIIYDLEGKTIIPGLIDVHAHYLFNPQELPLQENYFYHNNLAYGVTSIYDPSVNTLDYKEASQLIETGNVKGPRLFASGNIIMSLPGQYDFKTIKDEKDAERLVKSYKKVGVHGPIKDYGISNKKTRQWLRSAAKKYNLTITPDQTNFTEALSRIIGGYTSIEHPIGSFKLQEDILNTIALSKVNYTPTIIVRDFFSVLQKYQNDSICDYRKLYLKGKELDQGYAHQRKSCNEILMNGLLGKNESHEEMIYATIDDLKKIIEKGGVISIGAHGDFTPGINTHWELWAMTLTGLNYYNALKTATINGASKLDLQEELGSIEKNKLADLVILNNNPLTNIFNTIDICYTICNGEIFDIVK